MHMRFVELLKESWRSAVARRTSSWLILILVAAMCSSTVLTVGRSAAAQVQVRRAVEAAGSRLLEITDVKDQGLISPSVVAVIDGLSTVAVGVGLSSPTDVTNGFLRGSEEKVAKWRVSGDIHSAVHLTSGRWPTQGEVVMSDRAAHKLGVNDPAGFLEDAAQLQFPIVGTYEANSPFEQLDNGVIEIPHSIDHVRSVVVLVNSAAEAQDAQKQILQLIPTNTVADLVIRSPLALGDLQAQIAQQVGTFGRALMLLVLAVGAVLIAIVVLADVLLTRNDIGRRAALGATRAVIVGLIVVRTVIPAAVGAAVVTFATTYILRLANQLVPINFALGVAVLGLFAATLGAIAPAISASRQDPVKVLRTP